MNCPRCGKEDTDFRYTTWSGYGAWRCKVCGLYFYIKGPSIILSVAEKSEEEEE